MNTKVTGFIALIAVLATAGGVYALEQSVTPVESAAVADGIEVPSFEIERVDVPHAPKGEQLEELGLGTADVTDSAPPQQTQVSGTAPAPQQSNPSSDDSEDEYEKEEEHEDKEDEEDESEEEDD